MPRQKKKFWELPPGNLPPPLHEMEAWHRGPDGCGGAVYVIGPVNGCYKIGNSKSPYKRLTDLRSMPIEWEMKAYIVSCDALWLEGYLHTVFLDVRVKCEWFRLSDEDIAALRPLMDISREDRIPEGLRQRYKRNAARARAEGEARRAKWNYKDRPAPEVEPPRRFPPIPNLWVELVETGRVEDHCKKFSIPVPTQLVARIKRLLAEEKPARCDDCATDVAATRGADVVGEMV